MVTYIRDSGTQEAEAGRSEARGQPWLHSEPSSPKVCVGEYLLRESES